MPNRRALSPAEVQASITGTPGPKGRTITHISYSGRNTYEQCPKQYDLNYVMGAPRHGAVWFVGGSAVHRATELWDLAQVRGETIDLPEAWRVAFNEELDRAKATDPDLPNWRKAGVKAANPQGEDLVHWFSVLGPQLVKAYIAWRQRTAWEIWITPDGEPAIELDIGGTFPGMDGVTFKGFIDRVFYDRTLDQLHVVDLKTGTRKPENGLQMGVYAAGVTNRYGVPVPFGSAFMNRRGHLTEAWDLAMYTPEYVGRHFGMIYQAIKAELFVPKLGRHCGLCDVAAACYANLGPQAAAYDRDHPDNQPGF